MKTAVIRTRRRQGRLDRRQQADLVLVDRGPIILEDSARVAGIGIPRPPRPARAKLVAGDVDGAIAVEVPLEVRDHRVGPLDVRRGCELGAELAQEHRGRPLAIEIAPVPVPDGGEVGGIVRVAEPGLRVDRGRVVVRRVDERGRGRSTGPGNRPALERLPPHQYDPDLAFSIPSTRISQLGLAARIGVAGALGRQAPVGGTLPLPQVAGPCGSLCRSAPITVGLPL